MRVQKCPNSNGGTDVAVLDDHEQPVPLITSFLQSLAARDYSPNTVTSYAYDLLHFLRFLNQQQLTVAAFTPAHAFALLEYLRHLPSRRTAQRLNPVLCTTDTTTPTPRLAAATVNRILAAVSSFYDYLILAGQLSVVENPLQQTDDQGLAPQ
jgi:site-specific recombinase XerD